MTGHPIRDRHTELLAGLALFFGGAWLMWDATTGRGQPTPKILRPITFW